jgi:cytochrome c oxidase subunit 3
MVATFSNLRIGGILGFGFVAVQLLSWAQLRSLGYYMTGNPSASFFYLMTALHGLHMLGGLVAWSVVASRKAPKPLSIELVAQYWHFLLLVWAVLFGVMLLK